MKAFLLFALVISLTSCATYFSERPPILEDKLGIAGNEMVGTLATVSDYRVVFVQLDPEAKLCAEASPDNAQQISTALTAAARAGIADKDMGAEFAYAFASVAKQLYARSHGIQLYRDGAFALCNMHLNGMLDKKEYQNEMAELRKSAVQLILKEVESKPSVEYDNPTWPTQNKDRPAPLEPAKDESTGDETQKKPAES